MRGGARNTGMSLLGSSSGIVEAEKAARRWMRTADLRDIKALVKAHKRTTKEGRK